MTRISVIIPLYNESARVPRSLPIIEEELSRIEREHSHACEVIFVDDGSTDDTVGILRTRSRFHDATVVQLGMNMGKGAAIKRGFEVARGDYIFFTDIDLSTPLSYLGTFLQYADDRSVMIGNRKASPGLVKVRQPYLREVLGKWYTAAANIILGTSVSDFTCGFKMFPHDIGKKIFRNCTVARWGFDAESLYLARRFGYAVREVPVVWSNDGDTRVRLARDVIRSLGELVAIRMNTVQNRYDDR